MGIGQKISILLLTTFFFTGCTFFDKKNVAGLQVITNDTTSSLFLDGQYLDKTPFIDKTIKPGKYTLKIEPDNTNLASHETQIVLRKGLLTVVTWKPGDRPETSGGIIYEMEEIRNNKSELSFITIPDNTIIRFDQGDQQFSPLALKNIEPGHHQFELSLPSYEKQQHTINAVGGYRITITAKLARTVPPDDQVKDGSSRTTDEGIFNLASDSAKTSTISGQVVTIKSTGFLQNGVEVLRVRSLASPSAEIVGYAKVGQTYPYLNETLGNWYKIKLDDQLGWVSDQYAELLNE
ncbi:SH3 domain-containing protein [Patescibacteria group bacterium]|nr:SH3 domain-containing protein [Patescibacteria group bacterium]MBU1967337.1 SH3 domain-containing protein [Patescibacteria group bacterium]MBU2543182.1 SH3 domain-containing protein [Patescibacteria group bacterium]